MTLLRLHGSSYALSSPSAQAQRAAIRIAAFRIKRQRAFCDELVSPLLHAVFHESVLIKLIGTDHWAPRQSYVHSRFTPIVVLVFVI